MAAKKKTATKKTAKPAAKKAAKKAAKPAAKKPAAKKSAKTTPKAAKKAAKKPATKTAKKAPSRKTAAHSAKKTAVAAPKTKAAPKAKAVPKAKAATKTKAAPAEAKAPKAPRKPAKLTTFIVKQRQRLLDLRDELVDAMSGVTGEIRNGPEGSEASGSGMHQGDAGSDAYDRDFALSVLAKEQDALYEIEQALRRIERGVYGVCEMSGAKIPQARLEAIPFARLTVECQASWEKEYGNQRFRPASEVGFGNGKYAEDEDGASVSLDDSDD